MHHATPGMHIQLARQRQQALLDDARSYRQTERVPRRTSVRVATVALVACLGVGAVGLSQAKAATRTARPYAHATHSSAATNRVVTSRVWFAPSYLASVSR